MGVLVDPGRLTESGERCLARVIEQYRLGLPPAHLATGVVTPVEVHVSRVIGRLIALSDVPTIDFGQAMITHIGKSFTSTWDYRIAWLRDGFRLSLAGEKPYQDLQLVVEARNAVVHGDGQLTEWQPRDAAKLATLRKRLDKTLGVDCRGIVLTFGESSEERIVHVVREFVVRFDAMVLDSYPQARRL